MDRKKIDIYIASNVNVDYFNFLCKTIKNSGYNVTSIYSITESQYRSLARSSGFSKIRLRFKMYVLYPAYLIYKGLTIKNNSIFVVTSNTFFAPLLVRFITGFRNIKVIHLLYDLYPDALEAASLIKTNSLRSKAIGKIMQLSQKNCDATVYLGNFLKRHAEKRWGKPHMSRTIDISTDLSLYKPIELLADITKKLVVHYGGQMGHLHDAQLVVDCVKFVCNSDIKSEVEFNFYVSGAHASYLQQALAHYPIKIISAVSSAQWREDIANFHVGLVSLSSNGAAVCLPSKSYAMMAGGMAILGICPAWSDLASLINNANCGWVVNNSIFKDEESLMQGAYLNNLIQERSRADVAKEFYNTIKNILLNKSDLYRKRENAFVGVREKYDIDSLSFQWASLINEVNY